MWRYRSGVNNRVDLGDVDVDVAAGALVLPTVDDGEEGDDPRLRLVWNAIEDKVRAWCQRYVDRLYAAATRGTQPQLKRRIRTGRKE
mmetsp:Transcript_30531/g.97424  ORF Transcript_30531/g.97424 Transcript_30531/m.97424 type:complete len:87 (+) Transcript_30531:86-346(+)